MTAVVVSKRPTGMPQVRAALVYWGYANESRSWTVNLPSELRLMGMGASCGSHFRSAIDASTPLADSAQVRVLLVDDQRLMREGLRTLLDLHHDLRVVGEASDGIEAEKGVAELQPNVVLMDLRMPRMDGVVATQRIKRRWPDVYILVLTTFDEDDLVFRSIEAGASGYLLKDLGSDALADAVRAASRGEAPLQPSVARKILGRLRSGAPSAPLEVESMPVETLSDRELAVLRLLGRGASNRQIAESLALTEGTVKNYISAILAKTGLHDRTQAALFAVRHNLT